MNGMFWGGVLLSAFPILLGVGIGLYALRRYRQDRPLRSSDPPSD